MSSVKDLCKSGVPVLTKSADMCDKYVRGTEPKHHCVKPAQDVVAMCKKTIAELRSHTTSCKNSGCVALCQSSIKASEKAVEKNTACIDACMGAGSDNDCKIVCKDCADACRACIKAYQDCAQNACS